MQSGTVGCLDLLRLWVGMAWLQLCIGYLCCVVLRDSELLAEASWERI